MAANIFLKGRKANIFGIGKFGRHCPIFIFVEIGFGRLKIENNSWGKPAVKLQIAKR